MCHGFISSFFARVGGCDGGRTKHPIGAAKVVRGLRGRPCNSFTHASSHSIPRAFTKRGSMFPALRTSTCSRRKTQIERALINPSTSGHEYFCACQARIQCIQVGRFFRKGCESLVLAEAKEVGSQYRRQVSLYSSACRPKHTPVLVTLPPCQTPHTRVFSFLTLSTYCAEQARVRDGYDRDR